LSFMLLLGGLLLFLLSVFSGETIGDIRWKINLHWTCFGRQ
jgi:hypothetical protein